MEQPTTAGSCQEQPVPTDGDGLNTGHCYATPVGEHCLDDTGPGPIITVSAIAVTIHLFAQRKRRRTHRPH